MRISDWSSDVCSSDLRGEGVGNKRDPRVKPEGDEVCFVMPGPDPGIPFPRIHDVFTDCPYRRYRREDRRLLPGYARAAAAPEGCRRTGAAGEAPAAGGLCARLRSEEQPSELQSLMRISYAVFCLKTKNKYTDR